MRTFVFGCLEDIQATQSAQFAEIFMVWDEFNIQWSLLVEDHVVKLKLRTNETITIKAEDVIYVRFPSKISGIAREAFSILVSCSSAKIIGFPGWAQTALNKMSQLTLSETSPHTRITNQSSVLDNHTSWITKSLSMVRSQCAQVDELKQNRNSNEKLHLPTLIQEKINGTEYKVHVLSKGTHLHTFACKVSSTNTLDYRHDGKIVRFNKATPKAETQLDKLAKDLRQKIEVDLFDFDAFEDEQGNFRFLEWNDSPVSVFFENWVDPNHVFTKAIFDGSGPIVIAPLSDGAHASLTQAKNNIPFLKLEEYRQTWHIHSNQNGIWFTLQNGERFYPTKIYCRPAQSSNANQVKALSELYSILETHPFVLGAPSKMFFNDSKPLQLTSSFTNIQNIRHPRTRIVKRSKFNPKDFENMVVKSISSVRSIVATENTFKNWDVNNIDHLPVLFQETVRGDDVRVHLLNQKSFSVRITDKSDIDYRYSDNRSSFLPHSVSKQVLEFVKNISIKEVNPFIGVDFILDTDGNYHWLESNPGPGWFWFYNEKTTKNNLMAKHLNEVLCEAN